MSVSTEKKSLIIGANGLIGSRLSKLLEHHNMVWAGTYCNRSRNDLLHIDITNMHDLISIIEQFDPDIVFHCANLSGGVDFCELHPEICQEFHLTGIQNIGQLCKQSGAKLVFISSDYIFSDSSMPVSEDAPPYPLNFYGQMKLAAEKWIVSNLNNFTIIRTTNVYGWDPQTSTPNFIMNIYRTLQSSKSIQIPSYLKCTPTYVGDLVQALLRLAVSHPSDIYHVVGPEVINRFQWAIKACTVLGMDASRVIEVSEPPKNMIPRPLNLSLSTLKINKLGINLNDVNKGLSLMQIDMIKES